MMKIIDEFYNFLSTSNRTSDHKIKQFIDSFNLEYYFNNNKLEYRETESDNPQYVLNVCPFCNNINYKGNEHSDRLYVNKTNKLFICYNCNERGSLLQLLAAFEGVSLRAIFAKYLNQDYFEALPEQLKSLINDPIKIKEPVELKEIKLPTEFLPVFKEPNCSGKPAYEYWRSRGILRDDGNLDIQIAQHLVTRYCESCAYITPSGSTHFINKRIIFPVWEHGSSWLERRFVGFQGRDVTNESKLSYYISEGFPKTRIVYNYDRVKNAETITICEGIFDLIKAWEHNPICLFGKYISDYQLSTLQQMPNLKNIILALDPDTKILDQNGQIPYNNLAERLKPFWNVYEIDIPEDRDAGDLTKSEMNNIIINKQLYKRDGLKSLL